MPGNQPVVALVVIGLSGWLPCGIGIDRIGFSLGAGHALQCFDDRFSVGEAGRAGDAYALPQNQQEDLEILAASARDWRHVLYILAAGFHQIAELTADRRGTNDLQRYLVATVGVLGGAHKLQRVDADEAQLQWAG